MTFLIKAQQNTFSKVIQFSPLEGLSVDAIIPAYDNTYLLAGSAQNRGILINVDTGGNMLWNKVFSNNNPTIYPDVTFYHIIRTIDSCFLIVGSAYNPLNNHADALYIKITSNGDTIWSKTIGSPNYYSTFLYIQQTTDSGYIMTGYTRNNIAPNEKVFVAKTDFGGNVQWTKNLEAGNNSNIGYSVKQTPDNYFIVTGLMESLNPVAIDAFLLKLLPTGDISWSKKINFTSPKYCFGKDFVITSNGFLLYLNTNGDNTIVKTDFSGNVLWTKTFDQYAGAILNLSSTQKIHSTSDNNYIFTSGDEVAGGLSKIDSAGNLHWTKWLHLAAVDVLESNNKEYLIVGNGPMASVKTSKSFGLQIGIIQTDSMGNSQDCVTPYTAVLINDSAISYPTIFNSFSEGVEKTIHPIIDSVILEYYVGCVTMGSGVGETGMKNHSYVFPNPSTGIFTFANPKTVKAHIIIYDVMGMHILDSNISDQQFEIDLSDHPNGIYFYKMIYSNNTIVQGKLIMTN